MQCMLVLAPEDSFEKAFIQLGLLSMQDYITYRIYVKSKNILTLQFAWFNHFLIFSIKILFLPIFLLYL